MLSEIIHENVFKDEDLNEKRVYDKERLELLASPKQVKRARRTRSQVVSPRIKKRYSRRRQRRKIIQCEYNVSQIEPSSQPLMVERNDDEAPTFIISSEENEQEIPDQKVILKSKIFSQRRRRRKRVKRSKRRTVLDCILD